MTCRTTGRKAGQPLYAKSEPPRAHLLWFAAVLLLVTACVGATQSTQQVSPVASPVETSEQGRVSLTLPQLTSPLVRDILALLPPSPTHESLAQTLADRQPWTPQFVTVLGPVPEFYEVLALGHEAVEEGASAEDLGLDLLAHTATAIDASLEAVEALSADHPIAQDTIGHLMGDLAEFEVLTWRLVLILGARENQLAEQLLGQPLSVVVERLVAHGLNHPHYVPLKRALGQYFTLLGRLSARGEAEVVLHDSPRWTEITSGDSSEELRLLRTRLIQLGNRESAFGDSAGFNETLMSALKRAQKQYGLPETGKPDAATRAALSVPLAERLLMIQQALKALRHHPLRREDTRLELNIPSYELRVFEGGEIIARHRVIVGSNRRDFDPTSRQTGHLNRTPTTVTAVEALIVNPFWRVPERIKMFELDPRAERDAALYDSFDTIVEADGSERLVQRPGPKNALGQVQFILSGHDALSLHDTPGKALFNERYRALTHGSVRVDHAVEFAKTLLRIDGQPEVADTIESLQDSQNRTELSLNAHIPLQIYYSVVDVDEAGAVRYHPDVYQDVDPSQQ